jgi:hypothetical protein
MPIEVMPIWIVDRNRVGCSLRSTAARAPRSSLVGEPLQARLARGDQRDLGHGEQAVDQDQGQQDCYFHDNLGMPLGALMLT